MDETLLLLGVGAVVVLANLAIIAVYARQYKRVPPGHAMVVFGRRFQNGKPRVLVGGGRFIQPIIESFALISLEPMEIDLLLEDVVGSIGAPERDTRRLQVSVTSVANVSDDVDLLQAAASHLVHVTRNEVRHIVEATIEGHTRGILAIEASPEVHGSKVAEKIRTAAEADLTRMGITVRSLFLRVRDVEAISRGGSAVAEQVTREFHRLDIRIRRIEERLGLAVP